jgi:hypothetical protein
LFYACVLLFDHVFAFDICWHLTDSQNLQLKQPGPYIQIWLLTALAWSMGVFSTYLEHVSKCLRFTCSHLSSILRFCNIIFFFENIWAQFVILVLRRASHVMSIKYMYLWPLTPTQKIIPCLKLHNQALCLNWFFPIVTFSVLSRHFYGFVFFCLTNCVHFKYSFVGIMIIKKLYTQSSLYDSTQSNLYRKKWIWNQTIRRYYLYIVHDVSNKLCECVPKLSSGFCIIV